MLVSTAFPSKRVSRHVEFRIRQRMPVCNTLRSVWDLVLMKKKLHMLMVTAAGILVLA